MPIDTKLKATLEEMDEKYGGDEMFRIFGPTVLSWATTDSSRMYMFTSHLKQALTLLEPDVPRLQTGAENVIGKYNNAYKKLDGVWEVREVIPKFSGVKNRQHQIVMVVLYNKSTDTYEMIEKRIAEDLTEKFGFVYNTEMIDSIEAGQRLVDPILYKSTSYDKYMNYRYGKNANIYYTTATDTIEDAVVIRKGWADSARTIEADILQIPLNDNDVLLNVYGDDENFKAFPDIGEIVEDSLICATRRINKTHLLYDFQKSHMREVSDTDTDYYTSKNSVLYDINVYYNGDDEFPDNLFHKQLKKYYTDCCKYAAAVLEAANNIKRLAKEKGSKYTNNVSYFRSRYLHYNDPTYKWKNKDKAFNHIVVEFKVKSIVDLELGSKATGRYGNKGVISRISDDTVDPALAESVINMVDDGTMSEEEKAALRGSIAIIDDDRMPYYETEDGHKVMADILLNASGAVRRLNPGQLVEVEVNFIADRVKHKVIAAKTIQEKEELIFKFLDSVNKDESTFFRNMYSSYDEYKTINGVKLHLMAPEYRQEFIADIEKNGFYIVRAPHKPLVYDDVIHLYDQFPDIRPMDIKIDLFGIKGRTMIRKGVIGAQYMLILKQNSNKNFSARSTFRVNRSNLPAKDIAKKTNRSSYARTPVRLSEIYNPLCAIDSVTLAEYNIFMRSSALGRKSLDRLLASDGNPLKLRKLKVQDNFTNANADILKAKLKTMGIRIFYSPLKEGRTEILCADKIYPLHYGDYTVYDYPAKRQMYSELFRRFSEEMNSFMMIESYVGEKHDYCWDNIFADKELSKEYSLTDDLREILKVTTKGQLSNVINTINSTKIQKRISPDTVSTAPKKRGRKSKAEKEALLRQEKEAEAIKEDILSDEVED